MSEYRADPDGVLGILAGLDDLGDEFEKSVRDVEEVADDGATALAIDDRTVMSRAWTAFMDERRSVPGKIIHTINVSSQGRERGDAHHRRRRRADGERHDEGAVRESESLGNRAVIRIHAGNRRVSAITADLPNVVDPTVLEDLGTRVSSLGFGDVDGADQIATITHAIETNLSSLDPWAASATSMHKDLNEELARKGSSASSAVVLFMEWDSGGTGDVWNIERPDAGAERLAQLQRGFEIRSPAVQLDLDLHSLGTSMAAQMIADNEGLVDNVWFYGSAGVSREAAEALEGQIRDGSISLHVTHADDDWIAPVGRVDISEHPVDPRTIGWSTQRSTGDATGRPQIFSSNGGWVEDFHSPEGEDGERTEGHNSQRSTEKIYLLDFTRLNRLEIGVDDEAVGYLDPASQSYKQSIVDHVDGILVGQGKSG